MRVCSWKFFCPAICSNKSSLQHCAPSRFELEGAEHVSSTPSPVPLVVEEKPCNVKIEAEKLELDDEKVEIVLKSSLKKPVISGSKENGKGSVKWMDMLGKELVEVREFEPIESRDDDDYGDGEQACICVIQ